MLVLVETLLPSLLGFAIRLWKEDQAELCPWCGVSQEYLVEVIQANISLVLKDMHFLCFHKIKILSLN
jgi:hypothetical protein